jgi:hypothetical protein
MGEEEEEEEEEEEKHEMEEGIEASQGQQGKSKLAGGDGAQGNEVVRVATTSLEKSTHEVVGQFPSTVASPMDPSLRQRM